MNLSGSILAGIYLVIAVVVMLFTVWQDTLENPYASVWDCQGWVLGFLVGLLWPVMAIYMFFAALTDRGR